MAISIAKESCWLSSDDIKNDTRMVCLMAPDDVDYVDAGWFSYKVLRKYFFSSIFSLENSRYSWFTKSKVIIPVNLRNAHWVLIVIDIKGKVLYFRDSKGRSPGLILLQISRYLSFEYLMRYRMKLDLSVWKYVKYCKELDFPLQIDDSSCGIYICAMAKSIIYGKRMYRRYKLSTHMRAQVVRKMFSGSVEF